MELLLVAPAAAEVVVTDGAGGRVDDGRVLPAGQAGDQASGLAAVEAGRALRGLREAEPPAGGRDTPGSRTSVLMLTMWDKGTLRWKLDEQSFGSWLRRVDDRANEVGTRSHDEVSPCAIK